MPTPFSSEDLGRVFDARTLTQGRTLVLLGIVDVMLQDHSIAVTVEHLGVRHAASITPSPLRRRTTLLGRCSCGRSACAHLAAGALAALDCYPALRKPTQQSFLDALASPAAEEPRRLVFELSPGEPPHACFVSTLLVGERTGRTEATTPCRVLADPAHGEAARTLAELLGGDTGRTPVAPGAAGPVLDLLVRSGTARWHATGKTLAPGGERIFQTDVPPNLPPKSAIVLGEGGPWYVDGATGEIGPVRLHREPAAPPPPPPVCQRPPLQDRHMRDLPAPRAEPPRSVPERPAASLSAPSFPGQDRPALRRSGPAAAAADPVILERPPSRMLRLRRVDCPDDKGQMQSFDALTVDFDYGGALVAAHDERQFVRVHGPDDAPGQQSFVRRDRGAEAAALDALRQDGFSMKRIRDPDGNGRMVFVHRGRDAPER